MTLHRRPTTVGVLVALAVMAWAVPAQATVIDREHYEFFESVPDVVCGVAVRHDTGAAALPSCGRARAKWLRCSSESTTTRSLER